MRNAEAKKEYNKKYQKKYYKKYKERILKQSKEYYILGYKKIQAKRQLERLYGLSIEQYNNLFNEQEGCCIICGVHQINLKRRLSVDHCHKIGKIRGLLCSKCNLVLGLFKDDHERFGKAQEYLRKFT